MSRGLRSTLGLQRDAWANASTVLIGVSGASYLTTFVRERYFYQHAYGTPTLDHLEVLLSVVAIASNLVGVVLALWWSSGKIRSRQVAALGVATTAVAAATAVPVVDIGCLLGVLVAASAFLWGAQRAAAAGRQLPALLGALTAPGLTLASWHWIGIDRPSTILLGYLLGGAWQAAVAVAAGWGTAGRPSVPGGSSLAWPIVYMLAVQVDAVLDQAVLLLAGRGWAGAGALAFNLLAAASSMVVGPLGAQALAGRLDVLRWRTIAPVTVGVTCAYLVAVPLALPVLIKGGAVTGSGYHRIFTLAMLYGLALPFCIFWNLRTRAAQRESSRWPAMFGQALFIFVVHLVALAAIVVLRAWDLVPLATVLAFASGSLLLAKGGRDRPIGTTLDHLP